MGLLEGKVAVVTGASSGIGKATAQLFANEGANTVLDVRDEGVGKKLIDELKDASGRVAFYLADVSKEEDVNGLANFTKEKFGNCDILFNNAGIVGGGVLHETNIEEWDRIMAVDVRSIYLVSRVFIPQMLENGGGSIINNSSISGIRGDYGRPAYNAAKGAVSNLTRAMALDYANKGIRVNAICPGWIRTRLHEEFLRSVGDKRAAVEAQILSCVPMGRTGDSEEAAKVVLFLASDMSSFVTGTLIPVDGGLLAWTCSVRFA